LIRRERSLLTVTDYCRDWGSDGEILPPQKSDCLHGTGLEIKIGHSVAHRLNPHQWFETPHALEGYRGRGRGSSSPLNGDEAKLRAARTTAAVAGSGTAADPTCPQVNTASE
jgi:hypothetical protein